VYGRNNQIFCSQRCKNEFHNDIYQRKNANLQYVLKKMAANRDILKKLYSIYKTRVISAEILEKEGVEPSYQSDIIINGVWVFDDMVLIPKSRTTYSIQLLNNVKDELSKVNIQ
jgi:hypothetical protein